MLKEYFDLCDYVDDVRLHVSVRSCVGGVWLSAGSVHEFCNMLRATFLKIRLSSDCVQRFASVSCPPVPCVPCPLGHGDCAECSARITRVPCYDDGVLKLTSYDLPDYLCDCALTGASVARCR